MSSDRLMAFELKLFNKSIWEYLANHVQILQRCLVLCSSMTLLWTRRGHAPSTSPPWSSFHARWSNNICRYLGGKCICATYLCIFHCNCDLQKRTELMYPHVVYFKNLTEVLGDLIIRNRDPLWILPTNVLGDTSPAWYFNVKVRLSTLL